MRIEVYKKHPNAIIPKQGSKFAAAYDLYATEDVKLGATHSFDGYKDHMKILDTGLVFAIPHNFCGEIRDRSGLAAKFGIHVLAGIIDSDYRMDTVKVVLINHSNSHYQIKQGDRIAQLLIRPVVVGINFQEVQTFSEDTITLPEQISRPLPSIFQKQQIGQGCCKQTPENVSNYFDHTIKDRSGGLGSTGK